MSKKVLIVEDEVLVALDYEDLVMSLGYQVVGLASTNRHVQKLAQYADIALVDLNLADGRSGIEIGRSLSDQYGIQVIFVTGSPQELGSGIPGTVGVISKPVGDAHLREALDLAARRSGGEVDARADEFILFAA